MFSYRTVCEDHWDCKGKNCISNKNLTIECFYTLSLTSKLNWIHTSDFATICINDAHVGFLHFWTARVQYTRTPFLSGNPNGDMWMYMTQSSHGRYSHPLLVPGILCVWIKRASGVALGGFILKTQEWVLSAESVCANCWAVARVKQLKTLQHNCVILWHDGEANWTTHWK